MPDNPPLLPPIPSLNPLDQETLVAQAKAFLSMLPLGPAEALAGQVLSPAELMLIARVVNRDVAAGAAAALPEGKTPVDVTVRFRGVLHKGKATTKKGTAHALRKATIALLLEAIDSDVVRTAVLRELPRILEQAHALDQDAEERLLAEYPEIAEAFGALEGLLAKLPRIHVPGAISAKDGRLVFVGRGT